ncbi:sigma-54-dependent Fis family transcriptional regulator [bacterium]|nr:sigma-54-dependent Fis family transcriptional regulator [bacterium]
MKYSILLAEDDVTSRETLEEALTDRGYRVTAAADGAAALAALDGGEFDLVITDLKMPGVDGLVLLERAAARCPVILITAFGTVDTAVQAMKIGAFDFVTKPLHMPHLFALVERALQMRALECENKLLRDRVGHAFDFGAMIGRSPLMRDVFQLITQVAPTDATVCLLGESGTGKELVANAVHQHSRRADKPFIKVNCAAIAATLLESELFGHEKGSFTGAVQQRKGRFELADGGTLLLDEISEMSPELQAKLLRILQEQSFERVGGSTTLRVDVRVIAATNADLRARIAEGKFREDLYYRISVFPIPIPPLRARRDDIPLLVDHFIRLHSASMKKTIGGISPAALDAIIAHDWPGNVRQLENAIERACVMAREGQSIDLAHLPPDVSGRAAQAAPALVPPALPAQQPAPAAAAAAAPLLPADATMDDLERMAIEQALMRSKGNRTQAARALKIGLKTLYRKIEKYKLT